jgi:hypothetical protein
MYFYYLRKIIVKLNLPKTKQQQLFVTTFGEQIHCVNKKIMKKTSKELLKTLIKNQALIMKPLKIEVPVEVKKEKTAKTIKTKIVAKAKPSPVEKKK